LTISAKESRLKTKYENFIPKAIGNQLNLKAQAAIA